MRNPIAVGMDVGTSSLKLALGDLNTGQIVSTYHFRYENLREAAPGVVYVDGYWQTVLKALSQIAGQWNVVSVAVSTQMYSLCEIREDGIVAYQWNSLWERNRELEPQIKEHLIASGCQPDVIFGGYKAATASRQVQERMVPYGIKEYLIQCLTGRLAVDYATASASGLFRVKDKVWNLDFIDQIGLDNTKLPDPMLAYDTVGTIKKGLFPGCENIVVVPGLGDGPSASYACKDLSNFCGNLGTSMAARVFTTEPDLSGKSGMWNYGVDAEKYLAGGISSNSCSVLDWARDRGLTISGSKSGEVQFFPWLYGERMPYWSSDLRGTVTGMRITDGPEEIAAAVIKGVAFTFVRMAKDMEQLPGCQRRLILAGGGSNVEELIQVITGCLDSSILLLKDAEYLCAIGAAMCAAENQKAALTPNNEIRMEWKPTGLYKGEYEKWRALGEKLVCLYE